MDPRDKLILALGDELLRMSRQLSKVAEKKMPSYDCRESEDDFGDNKQPPTKIPKVLDIVAPTNVHEAVRVLLQVVGEDPDRHGLKETPERFRKAWEEMLSGYRENVSSYFKLFPGTYDEMVIVKDIPFTSFCEHHLLPFNGTACIGYVPSGEVIGLSKIARVLHVYSKRLQVQERLTQQVTAAFDEHLKSSKGAACLIEASHTCMACRGVRVPGATMVTSSLTGVFREKAEARAEFFSCIRPR